MTPRLSVHSSIFGLVFLVLKSLPGSYPVAIYVFFGVREDWGVG